MDSNEVITQDGEIIEGFGQSSSMAVQLQKAEVDQLISTARAYPRSLKRVQSAIMNMATLDEESAEECMYALPRGGKPIKGPSIRFAEILKQSFGNCRAAARVVAVDRIEMFVEAEGVFHDLETNSSTTARVRRRISDRRGKIYQDDMIIVTGNAACSIAMRNAILAGVPKPLWRRAYETVQATITGDVTTLSENREKALKALAAFGVKPEQIFAALGKEGVDDITVDDIGTLRGMYSALKNGEATVEEMFVGTVKAAEPREPVADRLKAAKEASQEPAGEQEGFDAAHVARETSDALTGEIIEPQNAGEEIPAPSADDAAPATAASEGDGTTPSQPSPSNPLPADLRQHLMDFARKASSTVDDKDLDNNAKEKSVSDMMLNYRDVVPEADWSKLSTIVICLKAVMTGKRTLEQSRKFIAGDLLDCSVEEIGG